MTTIVNVKKEKCDVYIDRRSPFGNKFRIGEHGDRGMVIEHYRIWFYNMLKDQTFRDKVLALKGKRLGCHCKPLACHGDIIVEYLGGQDASHVVSALVTVDSSDGKHHEQYWPSPQVGSIWTLKGANAGLVDRVKVQVYIPPNTFIVFDTQL